MTPLATNSSQGIVPVKKKSPDLHELFQIRL
jgi:hypothetical protein